MDNTEAVEKLRCILLENVYHDEVEVDFNTQAILAAIQADPLAYVKPKPIIWSRCGDRWESGNGLVRKERGRFCLHLRDTFDQMFGTLEAAQAAAYEDLCQRVKELY